jgi:hypothetical protein
LTEFSVIVFGQHLRLLASRCHARHGGRDRPK